MIYKTIKNKNYQCLNNEIFVYPISVEARCLLAYMLTKPEDWRFFNASICSEFGITESKLKKLLQELKKFGVVNRYSIQVSGRLEWITEVYESPDLNTNTNDTTGPKSIGSKLTDSKPTVSKKADILSTDINQVLTKLNTEETPGQVEPTPITRKYNKISDLQSNELKWELLDRFKKRDQLQIVNDLEDMYLWLESNGKKMKDYKAFATNWIKRNEAREAIREKRKSQYQYPVKGQLMGSI